MTLVSYFCVRAAPLSLRLLFGIAWREACLTKAPTRLLHDKETTCAAFPALASVRRRLLCWSVQHATVRSRRPQVSRGKDSRGGSSCNLNCQRLNVFARPAAVAAACRAGRPRLLAACAVLRALHRPARQAACRTARRRRRRSAPASSRPIPDARLRCRLSLASCLQATDSSSGSSCNRALHPSR